MLNPICEISIFSSPSSLLTETGVSLKLASSLTMRVLGPGCLEINSLIIFFLKI